MGGGNIFREKGYTFHASFKGISNLSPRRKEACVLKFKFSVGSKTISFRLNPAHPAQFPVLPCSSVLPKLAGHKNNLRSWEKNSGSLARAPGILIQKV